MSALARLVAKKEREYRFERDIIESAAKEHASMVIDAHCAQMRLHDEAKRRNAAYPHAQRWNPAGPTWEWCNAVVALMMFADEGVRQFYLASDELTRHAMVCAVLSDDGVLSGNTFQELPPR